jgi:hypothetical protein
VHPEVASYLAGFCDAAIPAREAGTWTRQKVAALAADADGLIACMADSIDEALLASCPRLRVVSATANRGGNSVSGLRRPGALELLQVLFSFYRGKSFHLGVCRRFCSSR